MSDRYEPGFTKGQWALAILIWVVGPMVVVGGIAGYFLLTHFPR